MRRIFAGPANPTCAIFTSDIASCMRASHPSRSAAEWWSWCWRQENNSGSLGDEMPADVMDGVGERLHRVSRAEPQQPLALRRVDEEPAFAHLHVAGGKIRLPAA